MIEKLLVHVQARIIDQLLVLREFVCRALTSIQTRFDRVSVDQETEVFEERLEACGDVEWLGLYAISDLSVSGVRASDDDLLEFLIDQLRGDPRFELVEGQPLQLALVEQPVQLDDVLLLDIESVLLKNGCHFADVDLVVHIYVDRIKYFFQSQVFLQLVGANQVLLLGGLLVPALKPPRVIVIFELAAMRVLLHKPLELLRILVQRAVVRRLARSDIITEHSA